MKLIPDLSNSSKIEELSIIIFATKNNLELSFYIEKLIFSSFNLVKGEFSKMSINELTESSFLPSKYIE